MTMLVTRQQAMDHLRIDDATAEADDLDLKILAASAVVLDYLEIDADTYTSSDADSDDSDSGSDSGGEYGGSDSDSDSDSLDDSEVEIPYQMQAATLLLVGDMHRYRDSACPAYAAATLPPHVRALLYPLKTFGLSDDD